MRRIATIDARSIHRSLSTIFEPAFDSFIETGFETDWSLRKPNSGKQHRRPGYPKNGEQRSLLRDSSNGRVPRVIAEGAIRSKLGCQDLVWSTRIRLQDRVFVFRWVQGASDTSARQRDRVQFPITGWTHPTLEPWRRAIDFLNHNNLLVCKKWLELAYERT